MDDSELLAAARAATENAYVPYSEYEVGAALLTASGEVYTGCNVENANYSNSLHAEEVAVGKAASAGDTDFEKLVVTSSERDAVTPCGMCRQTLAEFGDDDLPVLCDAGDEDGFVTYTLGELVPDTISPATLGK
jgi:cytidine deaminase